MVSLALAEVDDKGKGEKNRIIDYLQTSTGRERPVYEIKALAGLGFLGQKAFHLVAGGFSPRRNVDSW